MRLVWFSGRLSGGISLLPSLFASSASRPLAGRYIVITPPETSPHTDADSDIHPPHPLQAQLEAWGATVSHIPLVSIEPVPFSLPENASYDWIFMTSQNAVRLFFESPAWQSGSLGHPLVAAVGPATAKAIARYGQTVDFVASRFDAESAALEFVERFAEPGLRVLWPGGNLANQRLFAILSEHDLQVRPVIVYRTVLKAGLSPDEKALLSQPTDMVVFTSPSAVSALKSLQETEALDLTMAKLACLGPKTTQAALAQWGRADVQADPHTFEALAQAILDFYKERGEKPVE